LLKSRLNPHLIPVLHYNVLNGSSAGRSVLLYEVRLPEYTPLYSYLLSAKCFRIRHILYQSHYSSHVIMFFLLKYFIITRSILRFEYVAQRSSSLTGTTRILLVCTRFAPSISVISWSPTITVFAFLVPSIFNPLWKLASIGFFAAEIYSIPCG